MQELELPPDVGIQRSELFQVADAQHAVEVQLGEVDTIPVEAQHELSDALGHGAVAIGVGEVHQPAPGHVGVPEPSGLFAPGGVVAPEAVADVRQLQPGVHQDVVPMAGRNEFAKVRVAVGVGLEVLPGAHVQAGDAAVPPAPGERIGIAAQAISGVEERPQPAGLKGRPHAELDQGVGQKGKSFVALLAGRDRHPEHRSAAAAKARHQGCAAAARAAEDPRIAGHVEYGRHDGVFPDDGDLPMPLIAHSSQPDAEASRAESQLRGQRGGALEDQNRAACEPREPLLGRAAGLFRNDEDACLRSRTLPQAQTAQDVGPAAGAAAGYVETREVGNRSPSDGGQQKQHTESTGWEAHGDDNL